MQFLQESKSRPFQVPPHSISRAREALVRDILHLPPDLGTTSGTTLPDMNSYWNMHSRIMYDISGCLGFAGHIGRDQL